MSANENILQSVEPFAAKAAPTVQPSPRRAWRRADDAPQRLARSVGTPRFQVNRPPRQQPRVYPHELATVWLDPRGVLTGRQHALL